ncbi:MAG: hypothetical protein U9N87_06700 [Planctomycetota bacterium]|nr:hypothetical protein [Planctomycetota bacterium]
MPILQHKTRNRRLVCLTALLISCAFTVYASAAEPDEPNAPNATAKAKPKTLSPSVQAVVATNPRTPADWARAASLVAELDAPELAKSYLKKILDANPDQRQLRELADRFSGAMFVKMASNPALAPEAGQLADKIIAAVEKQRNDPGRIDALIKQLADKSPDKHFRAMEDLLSTGSAVVEPLIRVLADPARAAEQAAVRQTLARMGSDATRPLIALLESGDAALTSQAARALGETGSKNATVYLLAPCASPESPAAVRSAAAAALLDIVGAVPGPEQAARILSKQAREYYDGRLNLNADENGRVTVWHWDVAKKRAMPKTYPAEEAAVVLADRLAGEALLVSPGERELRTLRLATMLEKAAYAAGIDTPLTVKAGTATAAAAEFGPGELLQIVRQSTTTGQAPKHPAATAAALQLLGQIGSADKLLYGISSPGALARAAHSPDARVRMAAAEAIIALTPQRPFAGSSYVLDALKFAAATSGKRRVMLAGPSTERSRYIAGYLAALGYRVETAANGQQMLQDLAKSSDYEIVLMDIDIQLPTPEILIQQMRHDWRTASLPVGVLAGTDNFERAKHITRNDPLAEAFVPPHDKKSAAWQIEQLESLLGSRRVPFELRQKQAAAALTRLALMAAENNDVFNISQAQASALASLYAPGLGPKAAEVLSTIGRRDSQRALLDLAGRTTQPPALRMAALVEFRKSVQRHGILLTTGDIKKQYERYNQSEHQDAATQKILGQILDCIETPTKTEKAK